MNIGNINISFSNLGISLKELAYIGLGFYTVFAMAILIWAFSHIYQGDHAWKMAYSVYTLSMKFILILYQVIGIDIPLLYFIYVSSNGISLIPFTLDELLQISLASVDAWIFRYEIIEFMKRVGMIR